MGATPDIERRIAEMAADRTYKFVDRFGLPTFFALLMFALACFMAWTNYKASIEYAKSNVIKLELLNQIIKNQNGIRDQLHEIDLKLIKVDERQTEWEHDHKALEDSQTKILERLDLYPKPERRR